MDILGNIQAAIAEVPDEVGKALVFIGTKLEELADRIDKLEEEHASGK